MERREFEQWLEACVQNARLRGWSEKTILAGLIRLTAARLDVEVPADLEQWLEDCVHNASSGGLPEEEITEGLREITLFQMLSERARAHLRLSHTAAQE